VAHAEAVALLDQARRARADLERSHAAHALRSNLKKGDPCPVCERIVSKVPGGDAPPELSEAERAEQLALARESEAAKAGATAHTNLEVSLERGRALAEQETAARSELDERRATIEQELGGVEDPLAEIDGRLERLTDARERADVAQREREAAREALERNLKLREEFAKVRRHVASSLISVAGRTGLDAPDVDAPVEVLADHTRDARRALARRAEELRGERDAAERDAGEATGRLVELHRALDLGDGESIADAMSEARSAAELANAQRRECEAKRKLAKELDEREADLVARRALYDQLYRDCAPKGFVTFLLEERARLLLELASERLHAMTDRYRLELGPKEDINVIDDLDGEKRRPVDTLSGGETFLASLALALALADLVTREGGRLQGFFLDEGFGTLDADSFDVAMEGIERIVGDDRLIGLVSHVPGLRERVPDRIELTRGPDGMTRVLSGGALG
jgi:exonuclease SbcC